jgi:hypothetical protein
VSGIHARTGGGVCLLDIGRRQGLVARAALAVAKADLEYRINSGCPETIAVSWRRVVFLLSDLQNASSSECLMHKFSNRSMLIFVIGLMLGVVLIGLGFAYVVPLKKRIFPGWSSHAVLLRSKA